MLAQVMDHYKAANNEEMIKQYVQRIKRGEFKVSKKYAKQLHLLLLTMQFDDVEKLNSTGEKKQALVGYVQIYKAPESSEEARKNAAYNIATLFYQLGDAERTYKWSVEALNLMKSEDISKFESSFLAMATDIFGKRRFTEASTLNEKILDKICTKKSKNKNSFYKNAHVIYLADGNLPAARRVVAKGWKCKVPFSMIREGRIELIKYMTFNKNWGDLKGMIEAVKKDRRIIPAIIYPMAQLAEALKESGRLEDSRTVEREMIVFYKNAKKTRADIPLEGLDAIAEIMMSDLRIEVAKLQAIKLSFPENLYNQSLKEKFSQLDKVTSSALNVLGVGSGRGIVSSYKYLVESYEGLASDVRNFTPDGKSESYLESFKKGMTDLTEPILVKAAEFRREAVKQISSSSILSFKNNYFLQDKQLPVDARHFYSRGAVLMDRGGTK